MNKKEIPEPVDADFLRGYLDAAVWTGTEGEEGTPLEEFGYTIDDFSDEALAEATKDCNNFIKVAEKDLEATGYKNWDRHGHDFWLTRNGHGAGFWSRDYGDVGDALTKKSKTFGSSDIYLGDDKKLYLT